MSLKSDRWIRRQCKPPQGYLKVGDGYFEVEKDEADKWVFRINGFPVFDSDVEKVKEYGPEHANTFRPMIDPFEPYQIKLSALRPATQAEITQDGLEDAGAAVMVQDKVISYGTSSYGYDIRCGREFKVFTNVNSTVVDPKHFDENNYVTMEGDKCIIPPNSFALARSLERFIIPRNILTVCLGKSTYARCGIIVNVTPFEPEWEGYATLEFSNTTPLPAIIYAGEGCAQVLFMAADETCEISYKDRNGKYMNQGDKPEDAKV